MATKRKRTHHRKHRRKSKGLFGIGMAGGAAERLLGVAVGAAGTRIVMRNVDDEQIGNMVAVGVGGYIALNYSEGFMNGVGLGIAVEAGLSWGGHHMPWLCGISDSTADKVEREITGMNRMTIGANDTIRIGEAGGWGEW